MCLCWEDCRERYMHLPESEPELLILLSSFCSFSHLFASKFLVAWRYIIGWAISFAMELAHTPLSWGTLLLSCYQHDTFFPPALYCLEIGLIGIMNHEASNKKSHKAKIERLKSHGTFSFLACQEIQVFPFLQNEITTLHPAVHSREEGDLYIAVDEE